MCSIPIPTPLQLVPGGTMCFGKPGVPTKKNEDQQECEVFLYIFYDFTWGRGEKGKHKCRQERERVQQQIVEVVATASPKESTVNLKSIWINSHYLRVVWLPNAIITYNYSKIWYSKISWWWLVMDSWIFYCRWGSFSSRGWHTAELARPPGVPWLDAEWRAGPWRFLDVLDATCAKHIQKCQRVEKCYKMYKML